VEPLPAAVDGFLGAPTPNVGRQHHCPLPTHRGHREATEHYCTGAAAVAAAAPSRPSAERVDGEGESQAPLCV